MLDVNEVAAEAQKQAADKLEAAGNVSGAALEVARGPQVEDQAVELVAVALKRAETIGFKQDDPDALREQVVREVSGALRRHILRAEIGSIENRG